MNRSVLEAHGDDSAAFAVLHQEVESKVLDEIVAVVPERQTFNYFISGTIRRDEIVAVVPEIQMLI